MWQDHTEAHSRPENCPALVVPQINKEIWGQLPTVVRHANVKMVHMQRAIMKATCVVTSVANELVTDGQQTTAIKACADALALLGHAVQEISSQRHSTLKPFVNKMISRICDESTDIFITDKLFRDSLSTMLKEVKELEKLKASLSTGDKRGGNVGWKTAQSGWGGGGGLF